MAKQLEFAHYQPLPFCKFDCPNMHLDINFSGTLYADHRIYDRVVTVSCEHEAVCQAARRQMYDEYVQAIQAIP